MCGHLQKNPWTKTNPLGNVKKGFIKIKPDLNSIMSSDPSANSPPEFSLCEVHPVLRVAVIMDQILSLLSPDDQLNFYCWLSKPEFLLEIMLHYSLHFVWLRFLGDPSEVCAFVGKFRTLRFIFYREEMPVPLPCVSMLLRARLSGVPENSMCFLEKVDLTSVIVNNEFVRFLRGRFIIKELIIGQSTAHFESEARFRGIQYLTIKNNSSFRGSLLLSNLADSLLTVQIIACKNLIVDKLKAFLSEDSRATAVVLDRIGIVKSFGPNYTHIFDGLFSGNNVIKSFAFTSPCMQEIVDVNIVNRKLCVNNFLTELNFENNQLCAAYLPKIVELVPNLESLNVVGVGPLVDVSFAALHEFKQLKLSYYSGFTTAVASIASNKFEHLVIMNSLGKKHTKLVGPGFAVKLLSVAARESFVELHKCRIVPSQWKDLCTLRAGDVLYASASSFGSRELYRR
ncbi:hypothetical protein TKK_0015724 [Trichogramma kaykai]